MSIWVDWMKNGVRVLMATGQRLTDEPRVLFRACAPEELSGAIATLSSPFGMVVLVREDTPAPLILADAELLLDPETIAVLGVWLSSAPSR